MTDYIDRQVAIDALMSLTIYKSKREIAQAADKDENSWIGGVAECIDEIEDLPSVQPEIIRCKDCKYWMRAYLSISGKHGCNVMRDYTAPDDYCFKAEGIKNECDERKNFE